MHQFGELHIHQIFLIIGIIFNSVMTTTMSNNDFLQKFQTMAEDVQKKVMDAVKDSPAKDLEKNVRGLMSQGFQKMDLITRQEFDIQVQVLAKTRAKLEALEAKVEALEAKINH
jgi:BMFP domain-containing protein YqiC